MEFLFSLLPMLVVFGVFYLVLIVPEKKRKKAYMGMLDDLTINDEVMTRGGIVGRIISLDGEYMILQSDNTRLKMAKNAIANKIYKED